MVSVRRFFAPLLIGAGAALLYFFANVSKLNQTIFGVNEFYGEQFFSVFATLYAIITALVLVKGMEAFDHLNLSISQEAAKIRSINCYFLYYNISSHAKNADRIQSIRTILNTYVQRILEKANAGRSHENDGLIAQCVLACSEIECEDENDRIALGEIMRGLDELRMIRSDRISASNQKIPPYLIYMLAVMTIALTLPFYLHHDLGLNFNYYIVFMIGTFGSFIFFLLTDINRPYSGGWTVDFTPYAETSVELSSALRN